MKQKELYQQPTIRTVASSLEVGMHFRLPPLGSKSRRQWHKTDRVSQTEIKAKPVSGKAPTLWISPGTKVLRLLSEDKNLA